MSALSDIREKEFSAWTKTEKCIVECWEMQGLEWMAEAAAREQEDKDAELLALRERVAKLEKQLLTAQKTAVYFHELGHGVRPSAVALRLLKEYKAIISQ